MKRAVIFFIGLGVFAFCLWYFGDVTPARVREWIRGYGAWAPLVFVALFCLSPLAPCFGAVMAIAGGMIFGLWEGSALVFAGSLGSSALAWSIVRRLGSAPREAVEKRITPHLLKGLRAHGFYLVLLLRLVPLVPFDLLSYGAALAGVKLRTILAGTALGVIPGVLVYANIGAQSLNVHSGYFYGSLALLVLLCAVSVALKKRLSRLLNGRENNKGALDR